MVGRAVHAVWLLSQKAADAGDATYRLRGR